MVLRPEARFDIARRLSDEGIPLGELFSFLSGLYFRGKLTYASVYANPPPGSPGILVITPCKGLLAPDTMVSMMDLALFARGDICESDRAFALPFSRDARALAESTTAQTDIILLGSVATRKYLTVLLEHFGTRLKFPGDFVGRGDMSRGGLLLRSATDGPELDYTPVEGAVLHGKRPPRLPARRYCNPERSRGKGVR
jgi:hypothetical protein